MNKELLFQFEVDAQDRHGEVVVEKVVEYVIEHVLAITRMRGPRNGTNSAENIILSKVREDIIAYFDVQERSVNEIFDTNELFREYFKLPKRGDRTYVTLKDNNV